MNLRAALWILFGLATAALLIAVAVDVVGDALRRDDALTAGVLVVAAIYGAWRLGRAIDCQVRGALRSSD